MFIDEIEIKARKQHVNINKSAQLQWAICCHHDHNPNQYDQFKKHKLKNSINLQETFDGHYGTRHGNQRKGN